MNIHVLNINMYISGMLAINNTLHTVYYSSIYLLLQYFVGSFPVKKKKQENTLNEKVILNIIQIVYMPHSV